MQTLKIELTGNTSLQELKKLERKNLIRILKQPELAVYTLPGESMNDEDFRNWVAFAEETSLISLTEAKQRWNIQKENLTKNIR